MEQETQVGTPIGLTRVGYMLGAQSKTLILAALLRMREKAVGDQLLVAEIRKDGKSSFLVLQKTTDEGAPDCFLSGDDSVRNWIVDEVWDRRSVPILPLIES